VTHVWRRYPRDRAVKQFELRWLCLSVTIFSFMVRLLAWHDIVSNAEKTGAQCHHFEAICKARIRSLLKRSFTMSR